MRFIGHLDVMRYFQKAIRRAGIDIAYSQGFSPHQIMSFAAPLSVGVTSLGEYMDIEVNSYDSLEMVKDSLNEQMAEGIEVLEVVLLPEKHQNAMAATKAAEYSIKMRSGYEPDFDWINEVVELFNEEHVFFLKETKKGEATIDLKESVYNLEKEPDGLRVLVNASSGGNIKPGVIVESLYRKKGIELSKFALLIERIDTFGEIETTDGIQFVPLGKLYEASNI